MSSQDIAARWLLAIGLLGLTCVPRAGSAASDPVRQDDTGWVESSQYIPSFDGTRLAITIHRPGRGDQPAGEALPVIVTQDRSANTAAGEQRMRRFTDHGYVWVAQDRRGTGASFGVQTGFVNQLDARDAKAVIEWAGAQTFSSGKVVAMGCSNQGAWQYLVATLQPKFLVAIAPSCASPQFFDDAVTMNGIPMAQVGEKPYAGECNRPVSGARPAGYVPPPPRRVDADVNGEMLKAAIAGQACGAAMLGQYWLDMPRDAFDPFAREAPALQDTAMTNWKAVRASGIAILQLGGWFDAAVAGQLEGLRVWGGRLIMGPWVHGNAQPRGADYPNGTLDLDAEILRWFDLQAKGLRNGADRPPIRYYTMNAPAGQEWHEAQRLPRLRSTAFYLLEDGTLSAARPDRAGRRIDYAPQDVRWFDGRYAPLGRWWDGDMAPSDQKSLSHTLPPLAADTELTGAVTAHLWISATTADANVFAVLEDVMPDGHSSYVTDGRLRASWRAVQTPPWGPGGRHWHRGNAGDLMPLVDGQPTELVFDFFPTSYVFKAGHRLRLSLTTSIGEAYQAPPLARGQPVTLTVYRDAAHASRIELPFAPVPSRPRNTVHP